MIPGIPMFTIGNTVESRIPPFECEIWTSLLLNKLSIKEMFQFLI